MTLPAKYIIFNGTNNPIRNLTGNNFAALCCNHIFKNESKVDESEESKDSKVLFIEKAILIC